MDENAYRQMVSAQHPRLCPFEKSILTRCAACSKAEKHNIAEREIVMCEDVNARADCAALHDALRRKFMFALGRTNSGEPLPHAQEMRVQCGGLMGLQIEMDAAHQVGDIARLVESARLRFGDWEDFPYANIVVSANTNYRSR